MTNVDFIKKIEEIGFKNVTETTYGIESFDDVVTNYKKFNEFLTFAKDTMRISIMNPEGYDEKLDCGTGKIVTRPAYIRCYFTNNNDSYTGKVSAVGDSGDDRYTIVLRDEKNISYRNSGNTLPFKVETGATYIIHIN